MTGEVLITGPQSGTAGTGGNTLANLLDGNSRTLWQTTATNPWAAQDAGVPVTLTRVRIDALGGYGDAALGSVIYASNTAFPGGGPTGGTSGVSFVQGTSKDQSSSASSISQAFGSNNVAGNCIVVGVFTSNPSSYITVPSVPTDTRGNTYVLVRGPIQVSSTTSPFNSTCAYVYVAMNIAAGANTVSATFAASAPYSEIGITEYSGVGTASVVDTSGSGTTQGAGGTVSASLTTTYATDVFVAYGNTTGGTVTQASGFTGRIAFPSFNSWISDNLSVSTPSTYAPTWTVSGTSAGDTQFVIVVALKAPSASGGSTNLLNLSNRLVTGTLLNEFLVSPGQAFRYYALQCFANNGRIANLDFIGQWASGISAQPVSPTISPAGGCFEYSVLVTLSTITSGVQIYYTVDGSTPTNTSTLYSGAFSVTTTATLKVVAYDAATSAYSRVSSDRFHIGSGQIISSDVPLADYGRGYRIWALDPYIFKDPISGWWYMYGISSDTVGVYYTGYIGINVYRSADLKNWQFRGNCTALASGQELGSQTYYQRPVVVYNAANNNYVLWHLGWQSASSSLNSNVSSSPEGPFTFVNNYPTPNGLAHPGDFCLFKDVDNSVYLVVGDSSATLQICKLSADYKAITGTYQNYTMSTVFGRAVEAPHMFLRNGVYYLVYSGVTGWQANLNGYATSSSPMGTWATQPSPFQPVSGGVAGTYTDNTISFNTQNLGTLLIPGRDDGSGFGAFVYLGDAWNTGIPSPTVISSTASMDAYTLVRLPVVFSGSAMSISWNPAWSFDQAFTTVSGAPAAPSGLSVVRGTASWVNNEPKPVRLYLDMAPTSQFINVSSTVVPDGATSISNVPTANFYRVRAVNGSGSSASASVAGGSGALGSSASASVAGGSGALDGLNPPFMPITFPPGPPTASVGVYEDGPGLFVNPSNSTSPVRYNGQTQTATINIRIPRPV
jgi:hypothetical protein